MAECSPNAILITDARGCIEYVNPAYLNRSGFQAEEILGGDIQKTQLQSLGEEHLTELYDQIHAGKVWVREIEGHSKAGESYWEHVIISPVMDSGSRVQNILLIKEDITERKVQEQKILHQALHDALTELPNCTLTMDRINQAIVSAKRHQKKCALLFIDLDDFKKINDTQGHEIGDLLLKSAAKKLKYCVRQNDTVARQGGDEFIILLQVIAENIDIYKLTHKIYLEFQKPIALENMHIVMTASIGITVFPDDGADAITLLRNSDAAMYQAKALGGNTEQFFDQSINKKAVRKLELERHLRNALGRDELEIYFQPVCSVSPYKITGAEALLRWHCEALGPVFPDEFIPIAEQTGLIVDIGLWVLEQACRAGKKYCQLYDDQFQIAVNVSPRQFKNPKFVGEFSRVLQQVGFPASNLDVEVTEGLFLDASPKTLAQLSELKLLGANISMDDFGTGYSSLCYLRHYPFDLLKIDRSFMKDINQDQGDMVLVKAVISMARALGLKVIAEGVESEQQLAFIQENDCHYAQGFYLGKPVTEPEFEAMLMVAGESD